MRTTFPHLQHRGRGVDSRVEQSGLGQEACLLKKRDWIRGLIFSYAGFEHGALSDTYSNLDW